MQPDPSSIPPTSYPQPGPGAYPPPGSSEQPGQYPPYPQVPGQYPPSDAYPQAIPPNQYPYQQAGAYPAPPAAPYQQAGPYPPPNAYPPPDQVAYPPVNQPAYPYQQPGPYGQLAQPPRVAPPRVVQAGGLVDRWWVDIPGRLRRYSVLLSEAWSDGLYLTRWPQLSVILALVALALGLVEGATHVQLMANDPLAAENTGRALTAFTELLPFLTLVAFASAISANFGLMLLLGYSLGDLLIFGIDPTHYDALYTVQATFTNSLLYQRVPQLISYGLLAMLAVVPTLSSKYIATGMTRLFKLTEPVATVANFGIMAVAQGAIVYAWTLSAPLLIRIFWGWTSSTPPQGAAYYLQVTGGGVIWAAVGGILARAVMSYLNTNLADVQARTARQALALRDGDAHPAFTRRIPSVVRSILSAFYLTLLVSGFIGTLVQAIIVFVIVTLVFIARSDVLPAFPFWLRYVRFIIRIPVAFRLLGAVVIAYFMTSITLSTIENNPQFQTSLQGATPSGTFYPMVISMCISLLVMTIVLPRPLTKAQSLVPPKPPRPSAPPGPGAPLYPQTF